ncbi:MULTISPECIES: 50S ribosomal protein L23 [Francisella]|uniref:Large ribosomal subunit protein uL23 n=1 Tax=Francisella adeliensis TaxID=2007306 RepID=A0A2Z4XX07_9GAMM|nr:MULTISPECIES: 50S ribosomal protein L23 [Francisella]AXA33012.1 50S ribosomal protein L23 [Francisella adeliensis]MBK2086102.1 50S ribosomal protein L23 [Francisella adeliensis]MBK2096734.1 50S ribosomal protein L23 [Francisella adeliensis]QIW11238.1 50S ribosomal protein L23 [Francisella adeliensis]QIW13114.1 50S ribosomal protein L23 [Francisella adeliensis]
MSSQERLLKTVIRPHVSDKTYGLSDANSTIVFQVARDATKLEIKDSVEQLFEVKVESVNVLNVKGKARKFGRTQGRTKAWKKAYVRLAEGHDINFVGAE